MMLALLMIALHLPVLMMRRLAAVGMFNTVIMAMTLASITIMFYFSF
jgi:hypothetical protein